MPFTRAMPFRQQKGGGDGPAAAPTAAAAADASVSSSSDGGDEAVLRREERAYADSNAAYLRASRAHSGEVHGISIVSEDGAQPRHSGAFDSSGSPAGPQLHNSAAAHATSADASVTLQDQELGAAPPGKHHDQHDDHSTSKVRELLEPIGSSASGQPRLVLSFARLSVWAPVNPKKQGLLEAAAKKAATCGKAQRNPQRQILFDVSGQVRPGEVLALMGPSGSGKTTLLSQLGARSAMKFKGQVTVNGEPFTKATRRRVGFVLQDDVLYESLTVKETLTYAALLRLPRSMTRAEKLARLDRVVEALGLTKSRETIIGGFFRRGISGGERKRVSIGHELLINPAILLLDEPTSGLDSTTAMHLLSLLQDLAAGGRSIATTIHQPSSRLFLKLDQLMLLAEGHLMYYGSAAADQVLGWFDRFGYRITLGVSVADFILDVSLGEAGYSSSGATGSAAVRELYTAFERQHGGGASGSGRAMHVAGFSTAGQQHHQQQQQGSFGASKPLPVSSSSASGNGRLLPSELAFSVRSSNGTPQAGVGSFNLLQSASAGSTDKATTAALPGGQQQQPQVEHKQHSTSGKERAPYVEQFRVLLQRTARVRRFEQLTGQNLFQLLAVAFITGLVWWQRGQAYNGGVQAASDVLGLLFFVLLFPSMRALFRSLFTFPNEFRMLLKERPSGMYKLSAYYLARTVADVPSEMLNTLLFVVIAYWFGGLRRDAGAFFGLLFSLILVVLTAESWGLLIGGAVMEPKTAQTITTVVILTMLLVGGYYVRSIPVWIGWIRYLSFLYWGNNLFIKSQFRNVTFYSCTTGACHPVPVQQLSLGVSPADPAWPDVLVLLAMLFFLRVVVYFVLRHKTKVVQHHMK